MHANPSQTYDIPILNETTYDTLLSSWTRPGGCNDIITSCQASLSHSPLLSHSPCESIYANCEAPVAAALSHSGRAYYDIAHSTFDPFPPPHLYGYLTNSHVLSALGSPVNYTDVSSVVNTAFERTFDWYRGGYLEDIAYLLDRNVSVHLVYGDRDTACNWMGGEAISLAIPWSRQPEFAAQAGYVALLTDHDEMKGMTRQLGRFSFSRVFQAGHEVPAYQPQISYEVFMRAVTGRDIATGGVQVDEDYVTVGVEDTRPWRERAPEMPEERCNVLKRGSCNDTVWEAFMNGMAVVGDWWVIGVEKGDREPREDL